MDFKPLRDLDTIVPYSIGSGSNVDRVEPALVELTGRLVGLYATIDIAAMQFVTSCLGTDALTAADLMADLDSNPSVRGKLMFLVAKSRFRDREGGLDFVRTVLSRVNHAKGIRRRLVRDYWTVSLKYPHVLILVPAAGAVRFDGARRHMRRTVEPWKRGDMLIYDGFDDYLEERFSKGDSCEPT